MNEYDSQRMADILGDSHKMVLTDNEEEADVVILNTCSVREKLRKSLSPAWPLEKAEKEQPNVKIGVAGCVASQEGERIIKRAPLVDMVFGPQTIHRLPSMINKAQNNAISIVDVTFPESEKFDHLPAHKNRRGHGLCIGDGRLLEVLLLLRRALHAWRRI